MRATVAWFLMLSIAVGFVACEKNHPLEDVEEPGQPSGFQTELVPSGVSLSWKASTHTVRYEVFRQSGEQTQLLARTQSLAFQDTTVQEDGTYTYWVRGIGAGPENDGFLSPDEGLIGPESVHKPITFHKPQLEWKLGDVLAATLLDFGTSPERHASVRNRGGGEIKWQMTATEPWVQFDPNEGTVSNTWRTFAIRIDRQHPSLACQSGQYEAKITLQGDVGEPSEWTLQMQIAEEPMLSVQPERLKLVVGETHEIEIHNTGTGLVSWGIEADDPGLLTFAPASGEVAACTTEAVNVQALEMDAPPGEYPTALRVTGAGQSRNIPVTVTVPDVVLTLSPLSLTFQEPNWRRMLELRNEGAGRVRWELNPSQTWLSLAPTNGELLSGERNEITVTASPELLNAGTHTARIRFITPSGQSEVPVQLQKMGYLEGVCEDILSGVPVPQASLVTDVGTQTTDSRGMFSLAYTQEGYFAWHTQHPDYLPREGNVSTARGIGNIGGISLIPVPRRTGEVLPLLGYDSPWSVALSDDERLAFVTNKGGFISIIDIQARAELGRVDVGDGALGIAYHEGLAYVANQWDNTVSVIDPQRQRVTDTLDVSGAPAYLVAAEGTLYVTLQDAIAGNRVAMLNLVTQRIERHFPVGRTPWGITLDPQGRWLCTANHDSNTLTVVDLRTGSGTDVPVGANPQGVAVNADGSRVYVANAGSISIVDPIVRVEINALNSPNARFSWVAVTTLSDGTDLVYATDMTDSKVWMWHPASDQRRAIDADAGPFGIVVTRDGRRLLVACGNADVVLELEN